MALERKINYCANLEIKYDFRRDLWQVSMDFRIVYDSTHRESLYNIMTEFMVSRN